jgi:hypothetical protein
VKEYVILVAVSDESDLDDPNGIRRGLEEVFEFEVEVIEVEEQ